MIAGGVLGSSSGFSESGLPSGAVGEDVQEPPAVRHEVLITGSDPVPAVAVVLGCRKIQHGQEPGFTVAAVVGEGLAGPFTGDQDTAARVAEGPAAGGLAFACAGAHSFPGGLGPG